MKRIRKYSNNIIKSAGVLKKLKMLSFNNITPKVLWNMEEARKIYNNIEMNCMHCADTSKRTYEDI